VIKEEEMLNIAKWTFRVCTILAFLAILSMILQAEAPQGWLLAGSKPADYETGTEPKGNYNDHPTAYLKSKKTPEGTTQKTTTDTSSENTPPSFGTLMQQFRADQYLGKRIRFSAFVKAEAIQDWAGLWMRVDKGSTVVSFDNMQDRAIKGSSDFRNYEVILDVPQDATGVAFGILLSGTGEVWINSAKFEVVDSSIATTGRMQHQETPANLDFEKQ
jgi:hypothetical protein